jgi:sulfur-oxidizing protein SoxZ
MVARVHLPASCRSGEIIAVRVVIQHPMETGFRYDVRGNRVEKNVIHQLICRYNGTEIFRADMGSGIAANPFLQFHTIAGQSGDLVFEWVDDRGVRGEERARLLVTGT